MDRPSDELIELYRNVEAAKAEATSQPYTPEGWAPWLEAAQEFQRRAGGGAVEQAVKRIVLHPELDEK
ncbi:hypothetical protein ACFWRZ_08380 [Streptomyces rubiginosohelvolus]|uniref:hypothetical protein n=1 Tax=Streptomyces rubiginosohelvolus TaxID=67362 RepID=UPI003652A0C5